MRGEKARTSPETTTTTIRRANPEADDFVRCVSPIFLSPGRFVLFGGSYNRLCILSSLRLTLRIGEV